MSGKVTTGKTGPTISQHGIKHGSDEKHVQSKGTAQGD